MHPFLQALLGGGLIGVSASILWVASGRIAGISGIVGELISPNPDGTRWRWTFLAGLAMGGVLLGFIAPERVAPLPDAEPWVVLGAGMLVGLGTRIGNGCTSGHGVCGIPRGSQRSLVSTATFIGVGMLTVGLVRVFGGAA